MATDSAGPDGSALSEWLGVTRKDCKFPNGMTVAELKAMVHDWPETDEYGEPCEVWLCDGQGFSNQARTATPLNKRQSEDGTKLWATPCLVMTPNADVTGAAPTKGLSE